MAALDISCPQCGRLLRLPDQTMLGRTARCRECGHRFTLQAPGRPQLGGGAKTSGVEPGPDLPLPREPAYGHATAEVESRPAQSATKGRSQFLDQWQAAGPLPAAPTPVKNQSAAAPAAENEPAATPLSTDEPAADLFPLLALENDAPAPSRMPRRSRGASRRRNIVIGAVAAALIATGIGIYAGALGGRTAKPKKAQSGSRIAKTRPRVDTEVESAAANDEIAAVPEKNSKPGAPITLAFVPEGARIVIHLRPADLWQPGGSAEEFRACLGPLGLWLESVIKSRCVLEPSQIEELLFALIPISRDAFETALVVRSSGNLKKSELIDKLGGELIDGPHPYYVGAERAWLVHDARTFATAPKSMAQSLVESADAPALSSDGIEAMLPRTDRNRHFTLICDLEDVELGANTIVPENAQNLLVGVLDFFGEHVETVCWSLHLGSDASATDLASNLLVRNRLSRTAPKLRDELCERLSELPARMLKLVYQTHPKTIGETKIVGRFPIMTKVVERSTQFSASGRLVSIQVELPERSGPNLALAALLTWNQTTLPGFGQSSSAPSKGSAAEAKLPEKIADRLTKKISVDFRREFMYAAIDYIGGETGVKFKLDGPGMKEVGITQNVYQTFAKDSVPATAVLSEILGDKLVLIVDEDKKVATVTSLPAAQRQKLTPFPLEPPKKK